MLNFLAFAFFFLLVFFGPSQVSAQVCENWRVNGLSDGRIVTENNNPVLTFTFDVANLKEGDRFTICTDLCIRERFDFVLQNQTLKEGANTIVIDDSIQATFGNNRGRGRLKIRNVMRNEDVDVCYFDFEVVVKNEFSLCSLRVSSSIYEGRSFTPNTEIFIEGSNIPPPTRHSSYFIKLKGSPLVGRENVIEDYSITFLEGNSGQLNKTSLGRLDEGVYQVFLYEHNVSGEYQVACPPASFRVSYGGGTPGEGFQSPAAARICDNIEPVSRQNACLLCFFDNKGIWTALGCLPTDPLGLVKAFFPYLLGLGGLSAFLLIVFSGIKILTSAGNPEAIQGAKETITSAVTGLLFVILSLFLLRLIGVEILGLPGLN